MIELTRWIPPLAYAVAALFYLRQTMSPVEKRPTSVPWGIFATGIHLVQIVAMALVRHRLPYGTMWEALSVAVAVLMVSYMMLERLAKSDALGSPFLLLATVGSAWSAFHTEPARWPIHVQSALFLTHVSLGVSGLALLTSASLLAAAWLWQYRQLRARNFSSLSRRVPDLVTLDRLGIASTSVGVVLLILSGVIGAAWMRTFQVPLGLALDKSVTVSIVLLWNVGMIALRQNGKFSSQTTAWLGFAGIIPVLLVLWSGTRGL